MPPDYFLLSFQIIEVALARPPPYHISYISLSPAVNWRSLRRYACSRQCWRLSMATLSSYFGERLICSRVLSIYCFRGHGRLRELAGRTAACLSRYEVVYDMSAPPLPDSGAISCRRQNSPVR
eukprot:scaffold81518_cov49-Prasinocladus_malaysianus.AAC.1